MNHSTLLSFGASGFAQNIIGTCLGVHLFVFYTDVVGLAPLWVSGGLVVATVWDAISDVWMGRISDRAPIRLVVEGRRRPYILIGAIPVGIAFVMLLSPPRGLTGAPLALYFTAALLLLFTAKTMTDVPALGLLPELSGDYDDRTRLASARELLGNVGDLVGLLLPIALLLAVAGEAGTEDRDAARSAFSTASWIGGALAASALVLTVLGTRESRPVARIDVAPLGEVLRALGKSVAFRVLLGASCLAALSFAFVQSLVLYVIEHVMREPDPTVHLAAFVTNAAGAIASYPLWTRCAHRFGKPTTFRVALGLSSVTFASVFFIGPGDHALLFGVMAFSGAANVGFWVMLHALNADVTDLDQLDNGTRREGLFAGFGALVRKVAFALAAAGVGVGLTLVGYVPEEPPSAETLRGLTLLFAIPPTVLIVLAWIVFRRFPLTRERQREIQAILAQRAARETVTITLPLVVSAEGPSTGSPARDSSPVPVTT